MSAPRAQTIRGTQVILLGMVLGVLALAGVAVFVRLTMDMALSPDVARLVPVMVLGLFVSVAAVYALLRRQFLSRVGAEKDAALELVRQDLMPPALQTLTIIGAALAEGAGLTGAVTLLIGGPWFLLGAPVLAVVLIAAQVPTRARVETLVRELHG